MAVKYCIGCVHLYYQPALNGFYHSSWTHGEGSPVELSCKLGRWKAQLDQEFTQEKFQKAMETAETCEDFMERGEENVNGR